MSGLFFIPGVTCLFLGVIFLLVYRTSLRKQEALDSGIVAQAWARLVSTGSRTEIDIKKRSHIVHYGIYEYDTADGEHISSASEFGYHNADGIPGAKGNMVKIHYNPKNPTEFALDEEQAISKTVWPKFRRVGILLTVLGILFTLAGVAVILGFFEPLFSSLLGQT